MPPRRGVLPALLAAAAALRGAAGTLKLEVYTGVTRNTASGQCTPKYPPADGTLLSNYRVADINHANTGTTWTLTLWDSTTTALTVGTVNLLAHWEGYIYIDTAGSHSFKVEADDSAEFYVDGSEVVQVPDSSGTFSCASSAANVANSGTVTLTVGWHTLSLNYYNDGSNGGSAGGMVLKYTPPSGSEVVVPSSLLYEKPWKHSFVNTGPMGRASGNDFVQPPRTLTRRWINFHPNVVNYGEVVTFTFTGFWATTGAGKMKVRLTEGEDCRPVYVHSGSQELHQQKFIEANRTAVFLMPSVPNQIGNVGALGQTWAGGFCFLINDRWQHISQALIAQAPPAETIALMRGFQTCANYLYRYVNEIPGVCGCFYESEVQAQADAPPELTADFMSSGVPTDLDNRVLEQQTTRLNLQQGCCKRWTQRRDSWTFSSAPRKVWGHCVGKPGASANSDYPAGQRFTTRAPSTPSPTPKATQNDGGGYS